MDHVESKKKHWETIYKTKKLDEVSWYQPIPQPSLKYIESFGLAKSARIIDVGGGDSFLVDNLLKQGYTNITILDISEKALQRAKQRLGEDANKITWIVSDILDFKPPNKYDLWHDRAALHFLTSENEIKKYIQTLEDAIEDDGKVIIGAFSEDGPTKCSGINIKQYSIENLKEIFSDNFSFIEGEYIDHQTPSGSIQNFTFCKFQK